MRFNVLYNLHGSPYALWKILRLATPTSDPLCLVAMVVGHVYPVGFAFSGVP